MHPQEITKSTVGIIAAVAGIAVVATVGAQSDPRMVNVYGEPVAVSTAPIMDAGAAAMARQRSVALTGSAGPYAFPASTDAWNFETIGTRQARLEANARGRVEIGPLEFLNSGPTGPSTPEAMAAATEEVTQQVQVRIMATDRIMASLAGRAQSLDDVAQIRFKVVAKEVADLRQTLTENLKAVREASGEQWTSARSAVATTFNAYVQAMHRAEGIVGGNPAPVRNDGTNP